jgi:ABC-type nitrate/sulfonate/bicarbonate transport system permease component
MNHIQKRIWLTRWKEILQKLFPVGIFVIIWQIASTPLPDYILPTPFEILLAVFRNIGEGLIFKHVGASLYRIFIGFTLSTVIGITLGFLMAFSKFFRVQLDYIIRAIQPIPGIAWLGVVLIWFGIGNTSLIVTVIITIAPIIILNTYEGFRMVDPELIKTAKALGAKRGIDIFKDVTLPAALPYVMNGLHMGLAFGWRILAAAEMIGATSGLGYWININRVALNMDQVFVILIFFSVIMILFEELVYKKIERKVLGGMLSD